jgi:MoxR-like ATPase
MTAQSQSAEKTSTSKPNQTAEQLQRIREGLGQVIRGKPEAIELLLVGVLGGGHVLVEDVPGVGKTTLAKALAGVLNLDFTRVQFTPDLLPADILGASVLDPRDGSFSFRPGPVFTNLLLADEINRASPRTQSALLEAMNEGQVSVDGTTRPLPRPFFVVATQNPVDYQGTYPLPEAQLDRFLLRIHIGYPDEDQEVQVLFARQLGDPLTEVQGTLNVEELLAIQRQVREVTVSEDLARYQLRLIRGTRNHSDLQLGVSPRGALALFRAAQARALLCQRDWVGPEDVQALAAPVLAHRVLLTPQASYGGGSAVRVIEELVGSTDVPT